MGKVCVLLNVDHRYAVHFQAMDQRYIYCWLNNSFCLFGINVSTMQDKILLFFLFFSWFVLVCVCMEWSKRSLVCHMYNWHVSLFQLAPYAYWYCHFETFSNGSHLSFCGRPGSRTSSLQASCLFGLASVDFHIVRYQQVDIYIWWVASTHHHFF